MTYHDIIASCSRRHLKTSTPQLRVVPHAPPPDEGDHDTLAWAKDRRVRGFKFRGTKIPGAPRPSRNLKAMHTIVPDGKPDTRNLQLNPVTGRYHLQIKLQRRPISLALRTTDLKTAQRRRNWFWRLTAARIGL